MTDFQTPPLTCANHPDRETSLRCNRCEKPICPQCAILTPTGYRCKECVKSQQKIFDTAVWIDFPLTFIVAGVLSYIGSLAAQFAGFFMILIAPFIGIIIAEAVRYVTHKRRSFTLFYTALAATILGCLPNVLLPLLITILSLFSGGGIHSMLGSISILWDVLYAAIVATSMYTRLSGIQLGRNR